MKKKNRSTRKKSVKDTHKSLMEETEDSFEIGEAHQWVFLTKKGRYILEAQDKEDYFQVLYPAGLREWLKKNTNDGGKETLAAAREWLKKEGIEQKKAAVDTVFLGRPSQPMRGYGSKR